MKIFRYITITLCVILSLGACKKDKVNAGVSDPGSGNNGGGGGSSSTNVTLTTQEQVSALGQKKELTSLTIDGNGITSLAELKVEIVHTLTIRNTSIVDMKLPTPTVIKKKLVIENNASLTAISEIGLNYSYGEIVISNNPLLTDISGFLTLGIKPGCKLTVEGNTALGEDKSGEPETYGFNVIKALMEKGLSVSDITLRNNHPAAVTDPNLIGQSGSQYISYTISSAKEAENFAPESTTIQDLTIKGPEITDHELGLIAKQISTVKGNVVVEGVAATMTEHLFPLIVCEGSITLKNIESYNIVGTNKVFNLNGFKDYTEIKGDLILENVPHMAHWGPNNCFAQITKIGGSLFVKNCGMSAQAFMSLEEVGGDITITYNSLEGPEGFFWNLSTNLTKVGGNLTITNNGYVNGLGGYEKLESIGGNVLIKDNGTFAGGIPMETTSIQVGFDLVQKWITDGVVPKANVECYMDGSDTPIVFN